MKQLKKNLSPFKRKIILENKEWSYRITSATVSICNPELNKKYTFFIDSDVDLSCECDFSPCDCFWWFDGPYKKPVKPRHIKLIIESLILETSSFYKKNSGTKDNPIKINKTPIKI